MSGWSIAIGALGVTLVLMSRSRRLAQWFQKKRVENRMRAVIEWRAHYYGCDLTDAQIERFIYDDNLVFKEPSC